MQGTTSDTHSRVDGTIDIHVRGASLCPPPFPPGTTGRHRPSPSSSSSQVSPSFQGSLCTRASGGPRTCPLSSDQGLGLGLQLLNHD